MRPITDANNEIIAYACTDISMNEIRSTQNKFTAALVVMAIVTLAVIYFISTYFLNQNIVKPIKELSKTAENYWANGKSGVRTDFAELTIDSIDEIGVLTEYTYGHEKGDASIKRICGIVCETFDHSPIFRIGGDEFAVILINNDLEAVDSLVARFKKTLSEYENNAALEPWEQVSAAIGYAVFEEGVDSTANDVFKRADANMYADKVAQKAQRK